MALSIFHNDMSKIGFFLILVQPSFLVCIINMRRNKITFQLCSHSDLRDVDGEVEKEIAAIYEAVPLDKNYSTFPLLVGPPRVGDRLVYKVSITFR
jgi:hypothetical protein